MWWKYSKYIKWKYIDAAKAEKVFEKLKQNINEIVAANIYFQAKMH